MLNKRTNLVPQGICGGTCPCECYVVHRDVLSSIKVRWENCPRSTDFLVFSLLSVVTLCLFLKKHLNPKDKPLKILICSFGKKHSVFPFFLIHNCYPLK